MTRLLSKYATLLKMNKRWNAGYKNAMRQHSEENGNSKLTLDEINEEIRQARLGRKNTIL